MNLNEYIMKLKVDKEVDKKRMIIDINYLTKMKINKNYEFSEKLTLPCNLFFIRL